MLNLRLKEFMIAIKYPYVINAPGGRIKIKIVLAFSLTSLMSKIEPLPSNSLKLAIRVSAKVNPNPIPIPSIIDAIGEFFCAKASARPKIIQFTTIRGINTPKALYKSGVNAFITKSTIVTNEAITMINAAIRTLFGIKFFKSEIKRFEKTNTKVVAAPIPIPLKAEVVTAKAGQVPKTNTKDGFSLKIPFIKCLRFPIIILLS